MSASKQSYADRPLRILPLRLLCRSTTLFLDGFAGPVWRSGLGLALSLHFPRVFELLFSEQAKLGRLYALAPPMNSIRPGDPFEFGLNLFGEATEHALACVQALAWMGDIGLGEQRGNFVLEEGRVEGVSPPFLKADQELQAWPDSLCSTHWISGQHRSELVRVELRTPLRIKECNEVACQAPQFSQLVRRIHGRLAQLCEAAKEVSPYSVQELAQHHMLANEVQLVKSEVGWYETRRRSSRSRQTMVFGGLTGTLTYAGDLAPFSGLLGLGEVLQLGGKTVFGFGCVRNVYC